MMIGSSGYSKTGKIYNYYVCKNAKKKICDKTNVRKEFIEDLVINECYKLLTTDNINKITNEVIQMLERETDNSNLKRLKKLIKDNDKQIKNLFDALKICDIDSVKNSIFNEIANMNNLKKDLEIKIAREELVNIPITTSQIKFFLNQLKKGNIDDIRYRKTLINVFVNSIYLYDIPGSKISIIFNTTDRPVEINSEVLSGIEKSDSSFIESSAPPK